LQSAGADGSATCIAPGTIIGVTAGTGLSGGGASGSVSLAIANNGVGSAQVADGSIASADLSPAAVTAAKIDAAQVQRRVTGTCPSGSSVSAINADGTVVCDASHALPAPDGALTFLAGIAGGTSSVVGEDGLVFVAAHDSANGRLLGVHCNDAACGNPLVSVIDTGNVGAYPSVTLVDGRPAIAYRDTANTAAKLALCADAACTTAALRTLDATGDVGEWTQIGVNFVGNAVIAYYDRSNGDLKVVVCQSITCAGATLAVLDAGAGADVGQGLSSMTIGQRLILGYHDVTANRFKVATCTAAATCGGAVVGFVDAAGSGSASAITVTTAGLPRLFWRRGNTTQTALCADVACATIGATFAYNSRGYSTMAATLDRWGHPVTLGVYEFNGVDQVDLWRCSDPACGASTVQRAFNFGNTDMDAPLSLILGANGNPVYTLRTNTQTVLQVCATTFCDGTLRR
jgi:hypothetical protein